MSQIAPSLYLGLLGGVIAAGGVVGLLTHWIHRGAHWDLIDTPTEGRKQHTEAVPTGGGVFIAVGVWVGLVVFCSLQDALPHALQSSFFWIGGLLMLGAGVWDDKHGLAPTVKLLLQMGAAALLLYGSILAGSGELEGAGLRTALYTLPLSFLWVVGVINAVNLIDGLDGLAPGVISIAFLSCAVLFGAQGELVWMAVGVVTASAILGFLPFNFKPASIFMGDSGSLFLGYLLAAYTLQSSFHSDPITAALILPILVGIPVLDTASAIVRRIGGQKGIFAPDRYHIHHRLATHTSEKQAVLILYAVGGVFGATAILAAGVPAPWGYGLIGSVATVAVVWVWHLGCLRTGAMDTGRHQQAEVETEGLRGPRTAESTTETEEHGGRVSVGVHEG